MTSILKILHPTDLSDNSRAALAAACEWAKHFGAELHLLHIVDGVTEPSPYLGVPFNECVTFEAMLRQRARHTLDEWALPQGSADLNVIRLLRSGSPVAHVVQYAQETGIDLIVMGTHGRSGVSHLFLGSVAENVVRRAPCSVLTVRPAGAN